MKNEFHDDIVFVDDDKLTVEIVSWVLKNSPYTSRFFTDPGMALTHLRQWAPRILVVDYYMPTTDGINMISRLAETTALENTSLYLCSGVAPRRVEQLKLASLGVKVIEKQVICNKNSLLELMEKELRRKSA